MSSFGVSRQLERELHFVLFECLNARLLSSRSRFTDFTPDTIAAALEMSVELAQARFTPFYEKGDRCEPRYTNGRAEVLPEVGEAWEAVANAGLLGSHHDSEWGGAQMPRLVHNACMTVLFAENVSFAAYPSLTIGAANLIRTFGDAAQKALYLPPMLDGRYSGTMALTEPEQGSALADIKTTATPTEGGAYAISGTKIYISGGDQNFTENIIHMVLARAAGAPKGVKGISLFICPKYRVDTREPNDVALVGLLHKMGYRQTTSTVLRFGENGGCVGYLVGDLNRGLDYMFQMMNEARINVGLGAAALGFKGYTESLAYAKQRRQGRSPTNKDPATPQIPIIEHSDVRRMLLAQKAYAEGALALGLYASRLVDDEETHADADRARAADLLLDILTPVVKAFASEYCVRANDLAVQIFGGAGYIREQQVEQIFRDNRLNPIHEGTTGIQALDFLGRKLSANNGESLKVLLQTLDTVASEGAAEPELEEMAKSLHDARMRFASVSEALISQCRTDVSLGLANATPFLDMAGRIVIAAIWLRQAISALKCLRAGQSVYDDCYLLGKLQTARYWFAWELPPIAALEACLVRVDRAWFDMKETWF